MEAVLFTVVGIGLYLVSDAALRFAERRVGRSFEHRSLVFLAIILPLALVAFTIIRHLAGAASGAG